MSATAARATGRRPDHSLQAARRQALIAAALALFVEKGFAATRMEEVALRAGCSTGLTYRYFPNKEALFVAVIEDAVVSRIALGEQWLRGFEGSTADLLAEIFVGFAAFGRSPAGGVLKLIVAECHQFPQVAAAYVERVVLRGRRFFAEIIRRGIARGEFRPVDPEAMGRILSAPLSMLTIWSHSLAAYDPAGGEADTDAYLRCWLDLILAGLAARPDSSLPRPTPDMSLHGDTDHA